MFILHLSASHNIISLLGLTVLLTHRIYVWLIHMDPVMFPVCTAGFAGAAVFVWTWGVLCWQNWLVSLKYDFRYCKLQFTTVQPQSMSLHGSLVLCVPTSQIQEEKTSESEGWQNVSGALGSCCYCRTVVVSPNSPTETGWVTSHEKGALSIVAALKKPATTCDSRELT